MTVLYDGCYNISIIDGKYINIIDGVPFLVIDGPCGSPVGPTQIQVFRNRSSGECSGMICHGSTAGTWAEGPGAVSHQTRDSTDSTAGCPRCRPRCSVGSRQCLRPTARRWKFRPQLLPQDPANRTSGSCRCRRPSRSGRTPWARWNKRQTRPPGRSARCAKLTWAAGACRRSTAGRCSRVAAPLGWRSNRWSRPGTSRSPSTGCPGAATRWTAANRRSHRTPCRCPRGSCLGISGTTVFSGAPATPFWSPGTAADGRPPAAAAPVRCTRTALVATAQGAVTRPGTSC